MFCQLTLFHYQKRLAGFLTWLGPFLISQSFVAGKESERSSGLPPGRNSLRFKGEKKKLLCDVCWRQRFISKPVLKVVIVRIYFCIFNPLSVIKETTPLYLTGFSVDMEYMSHFSLWDSFINISLYIFFSILLNIIFFKVFLMIFLSSLYL